MKEFNFEKELLGVQDELFRFAYKLTANREKAEDLLQDTLLKAMLHKESYNKNTNFKGWLFIIMRNTFINGYRAEVGHTRLYISSDPAYYSRIMDESRTEEVDKNYDLEKIRNAIKSVPESHFIPFEMYLSGFKYREIAERTGVSLGTIKSRIFHCRKKLKAILAECIIRKTKCFDFWERNVLFPKTKRSFFRTPTPLPCPFPLNFSLLIITKKFGNLAKNRYICIV